MATGGSTTLRTEELKERRYSCCSPCKENGRNTKAGHYCVDCEMYFCVECVKHHNKFPALRSHQVNRVQSSDPELSVQSEEEISVPSERMRCTLHPGKPIDIHCKDHDVVCCGICAVVKHRSCTTQSIQVAAKDYKSNPEVNKNREELTGLLDKLRQEKKKRTENADDVEKEKLELIENVDNYEEKIIAKVKSLADSTRGIIRSKYQENKTALDDDVGVLDAVITNTELHVERLESVEDEDLFRNVKMSKIATDDAVTILQAMTTDWKKKKLQFNFDKKLENVFGEMESFGQLDEDFQQEAEPAVTKYKATLQGDIIIKQSTDSNASTHVFDMCKLDSGDLLLADYLNHKLKRFNAELQFTEEIIVSGIPIAVCKAVNDEVAVIIQYSKVVQFVSVGQSMQLKSSFTLANDGWGMAYDAGTQEILACEKNKVSVYSKTGTKLRTYDKDTNGEPMFSACRQIVFSEKQQKIYVTDETKGLIVLDKNGTLSACVTVDISEPWPLCVLPGDICLVGSYNKGAFIQIVGDRVQGEKVINAIDGQAYTYCVLYDHEHRRLIIGGRSKVCVYTLSRDPE